MEFDVLSEGPSALSGSDYESSNSAYIVSWFTFSVVSTSGKGNERFLNKPPSYTHISTFINAQTVQHHRIQGTDLTLMSPRKTCKLTRRVHKYRKEMGHDIFLFMNSVFPLRISANQLSLRTIVLRTGYFKTLCLDICWLLNLHCLLS